MKKIFISADIEGTCGITHWDETEPGHPQYDTFADQMSLEVAAACEGVLAGGAKEILIKDAHDGARNIRPAMLPQKAGISIFRGWGRDPYAMMSGLDESFDGAIFTGCHSACGWDGNPLSHTMNTKNILVTVNGETMSELMMNSITASMFGVPVLMATGDRRLCEWFGTKVPAAVTVPVSYGRGNGSISIMPQEACRRIREGAERAMSLDPAQCMYPMPEHFRMEVTYVEHFTARRASWYPGVKQLNDRTVVMETDQWMDILTFFHFCL